MDMSYAYGVIPDKKEMVSLLDAVVERGVTLASQLHLSPKYLSDLLKQETGKAALELINL
jgi:YesN/AraC family two-component response regulator